MEHLSLVVIALCGFLAGCSAHINPYAVPQREPNYFWFIIAGLISAVTIWGGIEGSHFWFIMKGGSVLLLGTLLGALLSWLFRKESSIVGD